MSLIDGVNKVFKVQHKNNAMQIDGFKSEREMVEQMLYSAGWQDNGWNTENQVEWLRSLNKLIDETIAEHLKPDVPQESDD